MNINIKIKIRWTPYFILSHMVKNQKTHTETKHSGEQVCVILHTKQKHPLQSEWNTIFSKNKCIGTTKNKKQSAVLTLSTKPKKIQKFRATTAAVRKEFFTKYNMLS